MVFKKVTHVLFDMDGLLLNTEDLYTICFQKIATRFGKTFTFDLKCRIMGEQSREFSTKIVEELQLPMTVDEFMLECKEILHELFPQTQLMPGVKRLIDHLHRHKVPIGLATSSSIESYQRKTTHHKEFFDLFPWKTWGSSDPEVKRGKPYPDTFIVASNKFPDKPQPEEVLVFEDSPNGVLAALAAGMQVVMIPDPRHDRSKEPFPTLFLNTMEEFQPELFGLPAFDDAS